LLKSSFRPFKELSDVIPDERELMRSIAGLIEEESKINGNHFENANNPIVSCQLFDSRD
jgi:hypothetical protein